MENSVYRRLNFRAPRTVNTTMIMIHTISHQQATRLHKTSYIGVYVARD